MFIITLFYANMGIALKLAHDLCEHGEIEIKGGRMMFWPYTPLTGCNGKHISSAFERVLSENGHTLNRIDPKFPRYQVS